ncbi:hypothetical protein B296_00040549 [Ensete ventricosum]|uniref:Uncharacterized protein n=1 Tax=Ensete ventricosum TaxID=4639 RepID=A0A426XC11_ENSVE|nr:hypothetical protein B296_00040549 [Ensete ventricosum]
MGGGRRSPRIDPLTHPSLASSNQGKRWLAGISTWIPYHARRREGDEIFGSVPREISLESEEDLIMPMLNPTSVGDDDGCGRIRIGGATARSFAPSGDPTVKQTGKDSSETTRSHHVLYFAFPGPTHSLNRLPPGSVRF